MTNLECLQDKLRALGCHAFLVPSTDEYLSEFAQPFAQRLQWATRFSGSTGVGIVLQDRAALFLDGRYYAQGQRETDGLGIEILDASEPFRERWLAQHLTAGERLAIDSRLHSYKEMEHLLQWAAEHAIQVINLTQNPIDELWSCGRPAAPSSTVFDYALQFSGVSSLEKIIQLQHYLTRMGRHAHLLANSEDVAWLLNVRTLDCMNVSASGWHTVPIPLSRALVEATGQVHWFIDHRRLEPTLAVRLAPGVNLVEPDHFESFLHERVTGKVLSADLVSTPHRFAAIAASVGKVVDDPVVARSRWQKNPTEIARARAGHFIDGQAVIRFLAWLHRTVPNEVVTELDAAQKLTELRGERADYKGISMPLMSASGPSGAMAHYVPRQHSNRKLNDHPIYWMDSGGQYFGCSTDNTVCVAVSDPEPEHIKAHTLVVKGFIALTRARFPTGTYSTHLDSFARQFLWQHGMDYGHGTGHGVGSFMNIHEGPHIRREIHHPMVTPMAAGMIVSNEPAYYRNGDFGIRVESHMVAVPSQCEGFLEFETLSSLPLDPRLIDRTLLTVEEKEWLAEYHLDIAKRYQGCFDEATHQWLQDIVRGHVAA